MNKAGRIFTALLAAVLVTIAAPVQALAADSIDGNRGGKLTINCFDGDTPLVGAVFEIYRVASVDADGDYNALSTYAELESAIEGRHDSEDRRVLATTLESFILREGIAPTASGETSSLGSLFFDDLKQGMYLVLGQRHTQGGMIYTALPFMALLPTGDGDGGWLYDIIVSPKLEKEPTGSQTVTRKVMKVWDDEGNEDERPDEITVQLWRDGKVHATVKLSAANNWRYTWTGLEAGHSWTVTEKIIDDYTMSVTREGTMFIITNTYEEPPPPPKPEIPNTGQLWWPVPVLAGCGMLLIAMGLIRRRGAENED